MSVASAETPDASRKRFTNDITSSAASKKCKHAIDRLAARRNVQQALISFLEEGGSENESSNDSDDVGEKET